MSVRKVVLASGIGGCVVICVAALLWERIAINYLVGCLQEQPALFEGMLSSRSSVKNLAVKKYLEGSMGKNALFRSYVKECDTFIARTKESIMMVLQRGGFDGGAIVLGYGYVQFETWKSSLGGVVTSSERGPSEPKNALLRARIIEQVASCLGEVFRLPECSNVEFGFVLRDRSERDKMDVAYECKLWVVPAKDVKE